MSMPEFVATVHASGVHDARQHLAAFVRDHPAWWERHLNSEAVYAIPERAVQSHSLVTLFNQADLAAERDFARRCRLMSAIGVQSCHAIAYPLLTPGPPAVDGETARIMGWSNRQLAAITQLEGEVERANERLLGVAGRLVTEPLFLCEVGELREAWEALPVADRPPFPIGRFVETASAQSTEECGPGSAVAWRRRINLFLERWGLVSLNGWHLPVPQGPLVPSPLPAGSVAEPSHGVRIFLPLHYPLQGDDNLFRAIASAQSAVARENGLPAGVGPVKHHQQYAQMFRLAHLELVLRGRFVGKRPNGFVTALTGAAAAELGMNGESILRLRKWVVACRAGRRSGIPRLQD